MAEHKHAEVLRAIADGKDVQRFENGKWVDVDEFKLYNWHDPINNIDDEWRVKPEPKPDYCFYAGYRDGKTVGNIWGEDEKSYVDEDLPYRIKITIDGETNEPKSVELIK